MRLTLLGTGDAIGTPKIGCDCPQCTRSRETGEMRLRTSLCIENSGETILIDTTPDLRQQLLKAPSPHINAVIWTHGHYDHYTGFGEFYRIQKIPPVYADPEVLEYCATFFPFLSFEKHPMNPYTTFEISGIRFTLFPVTHPPARTCGVLIETKKHKIGFTSDTNRHIPEDSLNLLRTCDLLLLDAIILGGSRILKHMNYEDACSLAEELAAKDFRCIHMSHNIPWDTPHTGRDNESFLFE
ncbi:MAG: MBL fold metallo-hydrolase [Methanoregulaceae archaeon]